MTVHAVIFDLFETIVRVDWSSLPTLIIKDRPRPSTAPHIFPILATYFPELTEVDLHDALFRSWTSVQDGIQDNREVSSFERFQVLLRQIEEQHGSSGAALDAAESLSLAHRLADQHHEHVRQCVACPPAERRLLDLATRKHPIGLLSNFDHGPSARALLEQLGLTERFVSIRISDEEGWRKPHAPLFEQIAADLGTLPEHCLFIGDDPHADIDGAAAIGMQTAWIRRRAQPRPMATPAWEAPDAGTLADLLEPVLG